MAKKPQSATSTKIESQPQKAATKCIKMVRERPLHEGGPTQADVHPDEVENWTAAGWQVSK